MDREAPRLRYGAGQHAMDELERKQRDAGRARHGHEQRPPASAVQASVPRLLVFLHLALKQRALQGELSAALHGVLITTVGRIGDFDRALDEGQDAILTLPPVLRARSLTPKLQGIRAGIPDEPYALVGVDVVPDPARLTTIGALDLLGREGTAEFVRELIGQPTKVERVSKVEDLLPLLQMQRVDAIVVAARLADELRQMSRMNLTLLQLPKRVGLPTVAALGPSGAQAVSAIARLPASASQLLGVDEWR
jgi:hypothetical protein